MNEHRITQGLSSIVLFNSHHSPLQKQKLYKTKITKYHHFQKKRIGIAFDQGVARSFLTSPSGLWVADLPGGKAEAQYSPGRFCATSEQPQEERTSRWKPAPAWERRPQTRCWWLSWPCGGRRPSLPGTAPGLLQLSRAGTKKTCFYRGSKGNSPPACTQLLLLLLQGEAQARGSVKPHVWDRKDILNSKSKSAQFPKRSEENSNCTYTGTRRK